MDKKVKFIIGMVITSERWKGEKGDTYVLVVEDGEERIHFNLKYDKALDKMSRPFWSRVMDMEDVKKLRDALSGMIENE